jgi:hypothetical protein
MRAAVIMNGFGPFDTADATGAESHFIYLGRAVISIASSEEEADVTDSLLQIVSLDGKAVRCVIV